MSSEEEDVLFGALPEQAAPECVGQGLPRLRFAERGQMEWRAVSLDGLLADDHRVRLVWRFVEGLDLTALHATIRSVDGRPGHPPADPRILLALWLYATVEGIGSAREVARLCEEHIAFEWLCGGVGMNAKTLADFRVDHGAVLECLLWIASPHWCEPAWRAWIVSPRTGCGCAPRRGRRRSGGIRPCRSAGARQKRRCTICARNLIPIPAPPAASKDRDRHAPQPSDPPGVADWRNRMGGDDAKTIYKERAATAECANAQARNRGLTSRIHQSLEERALKGDPKGSRRGSNSGEGGGVDAAHLARRHSR